MAAATIAATPAYLTLVDCAARPSIAKNVHGGSDKHAGRVLRSPRDHDHNGLASGGARGQRLEAVEDLRNQRGRPGVGHATGVEDLGHERRHPRIGHAAGAQDLGDKPWSPARWARCIHFTVCELWRRTQVQERGGRAPRASNLGWDACRPTRVLSSSVFSSHPPKRVPFWAMTGRLKVLPDWERTPIPRGW